MLTGQITPYAPLIAALVAAAGWYVANKQANRRELRKEIREEISEVRRLVGTICESVREFQSLDKSASQAAIRAISIQQDFAKLDARLEHFRGRVTKGSTVVFVNDLRARQEEFFDLSTGDLIDLSKRLSAEETERLLLDQLQASHLLENALAKIFASEFQT